MTTSSSSSNSFDSTSINNTSFGQFSDHSHYLHHYHNSGMNEPNDFSHNQYDRFFKNYIHNQNFKIKVNKYDTENRCFIKLEEHVMYKNKAYDINNCFQLWIGLRTKGQKQSLSSTTENNNSNNSNNQNLNNNEKANKDFRYIMDRSVYFKSCKNLLNFHYRGQNTQFKGFNFNPYIVIDFDKQQRQLQFSPHFAVGIMHKSEFMNILLHTPLFQNKYSIKSLLEYNKQKFNVQLISEWDLFTAHLKIDRLFGGYKLTNFDYVCANMKVDQFFSLFKKSHTNHKISIAYIRKLTDNIKFGVQVKSINGFDHRLNFGIDCHWSKVVKNNNKKQLINGDQKSSISTTSIAEEDISSLPINIKAKIDTNLNTYFMIRYPLSIFSNFFQTSYLAYGLGFSSVFSKNKKLQQGISIECNI